jgi:four helix bundle protein
LGGGDFSHDYRSRERQSSMTINSFRDLRVWRLGMDLVTHIYRFTQFFPREEQYGLTSQMRRAAVSVPSNIAEGHARESSKEYLNHLSIVQGSLAELQTQIEIAMRLDFVKGETARELLDFRHRSTGRSLPFAMRLPAKSKKVADASNP